MNLVQRFAEAVTDAWLRASKADLTHANAESYVRDALYQLPPAGWLITFPNGTVFVDSEVFMLVNKSNGYKCVPVYAGEEL